MGKIDCPYLTAAGYDRCGLNAIPAPGNFSTTRQGIEMAMYTQIFILICFCVTTLCACSLSTDSETNVDHNRLPAGQEDNWTLFWHDEFDASPLDGDKWTTCYWWDDDGCTIMTNNELEWYQPDDVMVSEGFLILRAQERTVQTNKHGVFSYTSGMISSGPDSYLPDAPPRFSFTYGYIEIRALLPPGKGLWPAFWMLPITHQKLPEIDIFEGDGDQLNSIFMTLHWDEGGDTSYTAGFMSADFFIDRWHTYGLLWSEGVLIWYVDGVERHRMTENVPDEPMYIIANLAIGGDFVETPDESTHFPSFLKIDYIRVWKDDTATTALR
jgi:beta-glucanase (GH16 family)